MLEPRPIPYTAIATISHFTLVRKGNTEKISGRLKNNCKISQDEELSIKKKMSYNIIAFDTFIRQPTDAMIQGITLLL